MSLVSDLDAAMMQPGFSVPAVRRLGGGAIRRTSAGRPHRATGRDAVVYDLEGADGRIWALRCLPRPDPERDRGLAQRYAALASDARLDPLRGEGKPLPRGIQWISDGVSLAGPDFRQVTAPVLAMEHIPGRTLLQAVDRLCREDHRDPLAHLADAWLATALDLAAVGFVHGDLAADNLMVRPDGSLAIVDLDSALWPSASVSPPPPDGTPGYVHPRGAPPDPLLRDRFPALLLWASLRVLARHPELRQRWGDHPDRHGGALLWTLDDLRRPGRSPLFAALDDLHDDALSPLLEVVRRAIRFPPDDTPPLAEIAGRLAGLGFPQSATSTPQRRGGQAVLATDTVSDATWPGENQVWKEPPRHPPPRGEDHSSRPSPSGTTTTVASRERRVAAAELLRAAIAARDTAQVAQLWEEQRAVPEAASFAASVHLLIGREASTAIERALRRQDDNALLAAVAAAEAAGIAPSGEARSAARAARQRIAARDALRDAMTRGDLESLARLDCAGQLACLGRLDAEQTRAVARARAWPGLARALARDDDAAIVAAADPALWSGETLLPRAAGERLTLARNRLRWTAEVRAALRQRDGVALRTLMAAAPPGAEQRLTEVESRRILRFSMREGVVRRLETALRDGPDRAVVAALSEFEAAGAPFSDVLDWSAVRGVVDRISLVEALRAAATADPPDTAMLARLLPAARAALHERGGHGEPDWPALERFILQAAHLARLREALAGDDDARIASAALPDPFAARGLLTPEESERVQQALGRTRDHRR